jgi:hypothetical protein
MQEIRKSLRILAGDNPMTVRQVFYQAVGRGVIDKTEAEYKQTIVRLLTAMRRSSVWARLSAKHRCDPSDAPCSGVS